MKGKTYICLAVGITILILTSAARAQDEQWLQYHSEREAMQIVGDMMRSNLKLTLPRGVFRGRLRGVVLKMLFYAFMNPDVILTKGWKNLWRKQKNQEISKLDRYNSWKWLRNSSE